MKMVEGKWGEVEPAELLTLTKTEAQVWLGLYHLMCDGECRRRYHFNTFRKGNLLRIRKYLVKLVVVVDGGGGGVAVVVAVVVGGGGVTDRLCCRTI